MVDVRAPYSSHIEKLLIPCLFARVELQSPCPTVEKNAGKTLLEHLGLGLALETLSICRAGDNSEQTGDLIYHITSYIQ